MRGPFLVLTGGSLVGVAYLIGISPALPPGYGLLWTLPAVYSLAGAILLRRPATRPGMRITTWCFLLLCFARYCLLPVLSAWSNTWHGALLASPRTNTVPVAICLMALEFTIASALLFVLASRKRKDEPVEVPYKPPRLGGSMTVYGLFILMAVSVFLIWGRQYQLFQFLFIDASTGERRGDETSTSVLLLRQIVRVALLIAFVVCSHLWKRAYVKTPHWFYPFATLALGGVNVAIIVGERRTEQVYTAVAVIVIAASLYPHLKRWVVLSIAGLAASIVAIMTIYKHSYAFIYGSYQEALQNTSLSVNGIAAFLQDYILGPNNVAVGLDFAATSTLPSLGFLTDLGRSTFGLSFLLKGDFELTTAAFNTYAYGFERLSGHHIPSVSYGYLFFGPLLAALPLCTNLFLAQACERLLRATPHLEMKYVWAYLMSRFATSPFTSTPPLVMGATIMLGTAGLLYVVSRFVARLQQGPDRPYEAVSSRLGSSSSRTRRSYARAEA